MDERAIWLALHYGWQTSFVVAGLAGFLWLLLWLPLYSDNPGHSRFVTAAELALIESDKDKRSDSAGRVRWVSLFAFRETWGIVLAKFLTDPVWWFFLIWLPDFFKKPAGSTSRTVGCT